MDGSEIQIRLPARCGDCLRQSDADTELLMADYLRRLGLNPHFPRPQYGERDKRFTPGLGELMGCKSKAEYHCRERLRFAPIVFRGPSKKDLADRWIASTPYLKQPFYLILAQFIAWLIAATNRAFSICRLAGRALEPEADLPDDIRPVSDEADVGPLIEGVHDSFERPKGHAAR